MRFSWSYLANKSSNSFEFPVQTDLVKPKSRQLVSARRAGRLNINAFFIAGPLKAAASLYDGICGTNFAAYDFGSKLLSIKSESSSVFVTKEEDIDDT